MAKTKKRPTKSKSAPSKRRQIMLLIEGLRNHGIYLKDVVEIRKGTVSVPNCYVSMLNTGWTCVSENGGTCADSTCSYRCYIDGDGAKHHQCCKPPAGSKSCE
jgi:hypothetical protein